ncbi:MAG: glycosyltransferase family 4 protein [Bacteroidetes bacterium]|nr:glycosyltransferase family 4 protein [Bacteroidota bacterium]
MKIGIEAQRIFRKKKHGMDIVILESLKEMKNMSHPDLLVYAQDDEDKNALTSSINFEIIKTKPASYPIWEQKMLPDLCRQHKIDLLHATSNTAPVSLKIPLVVTIHDIIYLEKWLLTSGTYYQRFGALYRRWNVPRIAKNAAQIVTVSNYEKEKIQSKLKIPDKKIRTIYNACSNHFFSETSAEELETLKVKMNLPERFILFLGNTDPKKNLPNVLLSLAVLKKKNKLDFTLVMPDFGKENLLKLLRFQGNEHLIENIMLTGYIPNNELPGLYKLSLLFLYPSLRESFGIPILEAMASGAPLICSNTSAIPEIAGEGACYVNPSNPEDIAEKIEEVLKNNSLRNQLVEYGYKRAAMFSWKKTANELLELYNEII